MTATETATGAKRAASIPWRSPALIAIFAATLMTPMDVPLISPVLPEIQAVFGISESQAGLLIPKERLWRLRSLWTLRLCLQSAS